MFGRKRKSEQLLDLTGEGALEEALHADLAVIYKHSPVCPTSRRAMREIQDFTQRKPEIPVYVVDVVRSRALSQQLESDLGIQHESPQAIVVRRGQPTAHGSHYDVTVGQLELWCEQVDD